MTGGDYAELYRDDQGEWRTRVRAANHEVIFDSGEGYVAKDDAVAMLATRFPDVPVVEIGDEPNGL